MANNDHHTNDTRSGWFGGYNAVTETDTNNRSSDGSQKTDIFYSHSSQPLDKPHGHIAVNSGGGVEYWRDYDGTVLFDDGERTGNSQNNL